MPNLLVPAKWLHTCALRWRSGWIGRGLSAALRLSLLALLSTSLSVSPAQAEGFSRAFFDSLTQLPVPQQESAQDIIQSPLDRRQYQYLELPNSLKVLLISDPETDKAAAALDVGVGSGDDPKDREGLAHFLEHMLFLGTERYPEAGEYQAFISEHGGSHNAFTAQENTNYFFDVNADHLDAALDRFSQFFTAPLFTAEYVDRERHAVHSEFQAKIKDDFRRQLDVLREVVNPAHPLAKFSVGNLDTLADRPDASVRDALLDFYQRNYSSDRMTLVVLGRESLPQLRSMVEQRFTAVPKREAVKLSRGQELFPRGTLPARIFLRPEQDMRSLALVFPVPPVQDYYREKPLEYLGNLLGDESQGSLLSVLKAEGWAEGLGAGGGMDSRHQGTFNITVQLTESGLREFTKVAALVFKHIGNLRESGIADWRYKELQQLADIDFRFAEKGEAIHTVSRLANNLHVFEPKDILRGSYLFANYNERLIQRYLSFLRPDNVAWVITDPHADTEEMTTLYEAPYRLEHPQHEKVVLPTQLTGRLTLPEPNRFIPRRLSVKGAPAMGEGISELPRLIKSDDVQQVWFKQDNTFLTPKSQIYIRITSPLIGQGVREAALSELYVALVKDQLNEFAYPASLAGLSFSLSANSRGLDINISGYSDRQGLLLSRIAEALSHNRFDKQRFNNIKEELLRQWQNGRKRAPYMQALEALPATLYSPLWPDEAKEQALADISLTDLKAFSVAVYDNANQQILIHGNLYSQQALQLAAVIKSRLHRQADQVVAGLAQVVKLQTGQAPHLHIAVDHPDQTAVLYVQGEGTDIADHARLMFALQLLKTPFFHELRTQKQLGYIVFASAMPVKEVPGAVLVIQSPVASVAQLQTEMLSFLQQATFSPEEINRNRQALLLNLREPAKNLQELSDQYWGDLIYKSYDFDRRERLAKAIETMSAESLQAYLRKAFVDGSRLLWVTAAAQPAQSEQLLNDVPQFKATSPHYSFE